MRFIPSAALFISPPLLLRLESPTRTLTMEAPRGVEVSTDKGSLKVSGRKDLHLESSEGEVRDYSDSLLILLVAFSDSWLLPLLSKQAH